MLRAYIPNPSWYCKQSRSFASSVIAFGRHKKAPVRLTLPIPATEKIEVKVTEDHPLWGFFRADRKTLTPPKEDAKHGRSWTAEELRRKSFDDLHTLWITCLKERNILATQRHERRRQQIRTGGNKEASERDRTVRRTMAGIKFVLNERFLAWREAVEIQKTESNDVEPVEVSQEVDQAQSARAPLT